MGAIAERLADEVVVTSDNPRSEDPQRIIDQIVAGMTAPDRARRIEDRASAILQAVRGAAREDVVLLAGKGHEATQEIMGKKRRSRIRITRGSRWRRARPTARRRRMTMLSLGEAARLIPGAVVHGDPATTFERVSTDSRTAGPATCSSR
jgi:hypothetical protein